MQPTHNAELPLLEKHIILVTSSDKLSQKAWARFEHNSRVTIVIDKQRLFKRTLRLVLRRRIQLKHLGKMIWAELFRPKTLDVPRAAATIRSNAELRKQIETSRPQAVFLFRAGLIVNKKTLLSGVPFYNVHCADIPSFGGIASIPRALDERVYDQRAVIYQVDQRIDDGIVLADEPYTLEPTVSYRENENRAFEAGIRLLDGVLDLVSNGHWPPT